MESGLYVRLDCKLRFFCSTYIFISHYGRFSAKSHFSKVLTTLINWCALLKCWVPMICLRTSISTRFDWIRTIMKFLAGTSRVWIAFQSFIHGCYIDIHASHTASLLIKKTNDSYLPKHWTFWTNCCVTTIRYSVFIHIYNFLICFDRNDWPREKPWLILISTRFGKNVCDVIRAINAKHTTHFQWRIQ